MTKRSVLHAFAVLALLLTRSTLPSAQTRSGPVDNAANLMRAGQYDQVEPLLRDEKDPRAIAMRARAHIARGRYQEAEKLLTPAVAAAPGSDAALELGLLQVYLGRRDEATRTLSRVVNGSQSRTAPDLLRMAQAARALGRFQDSNTFFRDADRAQPKDAAINTAWGELFLEKAEKENAQKSFEIALRGRRQQSGGDHRHGALASDTDQPAAAQLVERALKINPNYVPGTPPRCRRWHSTIASGRTRTRRSTRRSRSIRTALKRARSMRRLRFSRIARASSTRRPRPS